MSESSVRASTTEINFFAKCIAVVLLYKVLLISWMVSGASWLAEKIPGYASEPQVDSFLVIGIAFVCYQYICLPNIYFVHL